MNVKFEDSIDLFHVSIRAGIVTAEAYRQERSKVAFDDESNDEVISKPYFEPAWPCNVSVVLGKSVALRCRVRLLGDQMVSKTPKE